MIKSLFALLTLCLSFNAFALNVPSLTRPVEDLTNSLTEVEKKTVESQIRSLHDKGLAQVSVLMINSLEGEVLESYSIKVAESWKLGTKEKGNGVLILIALQDRKMRIEVGDRIEGELTDLESVRIIEEMKSYMRSKDYQGALIMAVGRIQKIMEYNLPEVKAQREAYEAAQEKVYAERREALMMVLGVLLGLGLVGFSLSNLVYSFKQPKSLKLAIEKEKESLVKESKDLESLKAEEKGLSVDKEKASYWQLLFDVKELKSQVEGKEKSIRNMKDYMGDKT